MIKIRTDTPAKKSLAAVIMEAVTMGSDFLPTFDIPDEAMLALGGALISSLLLFLWFSLDDIRRRLWGTVLFSPTADHLRSKVASLGIQLLVKPGLFGIRGALPYIEKLERYENGAWRELNHTAIRLGWSRFLDSNDPFAAMSIPAMTGEMIAIWDVIPVQSSSDDLHNLRTNILRENPNSHGSINADLNALPVGSYRVGISVRGSTKTINRDFDLHWGGKSSGIRIQALP